MTRRADELPDAVVDAELWQRLRSAPAAIFLDYDGTLTPIVARPELAVLDAGMREVLRRVEARACVAILSGRDVDDVRAIVDVDGVWYAGSHGFDVVAPDGTRSEVDAARGYHDDLVAAADELERSVAVIGGAWVERKRYAVAVHFRQVDEAEVPAVEAAVDAVSDAHQGLRKTGGKKIFELRPGIEWDKGHALWSVFDRVGLQRGEVLPVFIGDDLTDEDAFVALGAEGVGIVVGGDSRATAASYRLDDPDAVRVFLADLASVLEQEQGREG